MNVQRSRKPVETLEAEYAGADLGDQRLSQRLVSVTGRLAAMPDASFPDAFNDAELEATYRFLSNDRVTPERILAPHVRQTVRRCAEAERFVVAHDTTEFNFGRSRRKDLGLVGRGQGQSHGFYGHFALAVSRDESRTPLGVLGLVVHARAGGKGRRGHRLLQSDPLNEGRRWFKLIDRVESAVPRPLKPVHVMDREADSYALMADLMRRGARFVIRMALDKRQVIGRAEENVREVLAGAATVAEREVAISARGRSPYPSVRARSPERRARTATLHVSAETVTLKRPSSANLATERTLTVNVVRVFEPDPPDGAERIEWRLWTTEPVSTREEILAVVDDYRARWRIEEFFKALKSGCAIESRQLETHRALVNALCVFTAVAWRLLVLRSFAIEDEQRPAETVLTTTQLTCLRGALKKYGRPQLAERPSVRDAMLGVAGLGGHIRNNGDPGWQVLGRGLDKLLMIELGYVLARAEM